MDTDDSLGFIIFWLTVKQYFYGLSFLYLVFKIYQACIFQFNHKFIYDACYNFFVIATSLLEKGSKRGAYLYRTWKRQTPRQTKNV